VLQAAIALADGGGLDTVSMRKLGQELGVEAMSLYNHVASKGDLLDGITNAVLAEIELPEGGDWRADMREHAVSAHDTFLRHPWAARRALSPGAILPAGVRRGEWMLRRLREGGFSPEVTYHAYHALDSHTLGFTLWQLGHGIGDDTNLAELAALFMRAVPADEHPYLHEHVGQHAADFGRGKPGAFELVLDMILDGLERMRDAA
jgi:AcrR family transcriptional regulator